MSKSFLDRGDANAGEQNIVIIIGKPAILDSESRTLQLADEFHGNEHSY